MLAEKGEKGIIYNVGSGKSISINELLDKILSFAKVEIIVQQDPSRMRPSDTPVIEADISRLQAKTGWMPNLPIEATLSDTLSYWRNKAQNSK